MERLNSAPVLVEALMRGETNPAIVSQITALYHFMSEDSRDSTFLCQIIDELLKVEPRQYLRVRDYFFNLNDNLERGGVPDPRFVGKKLLEQRVENEPESRRGCK